MAGESLISLVILALGSLVVDAVRYVAGSGERARRRETSQHIGTVGERIRVKVTIVDSKSHSTQYAESTRYVLEDQDGNLLIWRTHKGVVSRPFWLRATVTEHIVDDGIA